MILQALNSYYQRLAADSNSGIAPEGFAEQPVDFALEISEEGELVNVYDLRRRSADGKKMERRWMILPSIGESRGAGIKPDFLWGNTSYILGRDDKGKPQRTKDCQTAFHNLHKKLLGHIQSKEAQALLKFLEKPEADHPKITEVWKDMVKGNLVFCLHEKTGYLHDYGVLDQYWKANQDEAKAKAPIGICLVTGEKGPIARLHPGIKGITGEGVKAEVALCSYNKDSFCSYGKDQNLNAPVSFKAAFSYVTALNYLLRRPNQCVRLGNTNVVTWAERYSPLEEMALGFFDAPDPGEKTTDIVSAQMRTNVLHNLAKGLPVVEAWPELEPGVELHILGLAPNSARLAVSFYTTGSAEGFMERVRAWYADLSIHGGGADNIYFPPLLEIAKAALGKIKEKDVNRLIDDLFKAALVGGPFPAYLLPMCLNRLRSSDKDPQAKVKRHLRFDGIFSRVHAALIKAMLIRNFQKEISMTLNADHPNQAYQLGRLFTFLLLVQRKAIGLKINADIRDKYFGSASATPSMVFPLLLRNAQNHIAKAEASGYYFDKKIGEVLSKINSFPHNLSLEEQGMFALGYYHQLTDKQTEKTEKDIETQGAEE